MASYAHAVLHKFNIRPREFYAMDLREKAFIIASLKKQFEVEKEQERKMKSQAKRKR